MKNNQNYEKINIGWIDKIKKFIYKINEPYPAVYAAQSAFFLLLAFVPLASLVLAVTTYLPFTQADVLNLLMRVIPKDLTSYISDIINDLYARAGKTAISVSTITMLWSASKGILSLQNGFDNMYKINRGYGYIIARVIAIIYTIIFIVLFAIIMSGYVFVSHYYKLYIRAVFTVDSSWENIFLFVRYVLGWILFYAFILLMFVALSGGFVLSDDKKEKLTLRERVKYSMPGAAFSSIAWLVISRLVILYVDYFPNLSVMYGSLAGIVIIMLWLYFCMYSLFIGAVINYVSQTELKKDKFIQAPKYKCEANEKSV